MTRQHAVIAFQKQSLPRVTNSAKSVPSYIYLITLLCLHSTFTSKPCYVYIHLPQKPAIFTYKPQKLAIFTYICLINLLQRVSADKTLELSEANSEIRNETVFSQLSTISVQKCRKLSQVDCKTCPRRFLEAPEPS